MSDEIKLLNGNYTLGDQLSPRKGNFKGKVGTVINKRWSERNKEWMYSLQFVRAVHVYFEDEVQKPEH